MGLGITSSNGKFDLFSGCSIEILADFMMEWLRLTLSSNNIQKLPVLDEWKDILLDVYQDQLPEQNCGTDIGSADVEPDVKALIQKVLEKCGTSFTLSALRESTQYRTYYYDHENILKHLSAVDYVLFSLGLGGIFTAMELPKRERNIITHGECQEILEALKTLKLVAAPNAIDSDLYDRFVALFEDALKTPRGFVTWS